MTFQTVVAGTGAITQINENTDAIAAAGTYGKKAPTTTGLTWGYYGGRGFGNTIADGTLSLTASTTNYVVASRSTGAVSVSTATTNWNDVVNYFRLYLIVTGTSTITSATDYREFASSPITAFTGGTLTSALNEATQVTLASAATVNIGAAAANSISVTGTTTITAFDTIAAGAKRELVFSGVLTLTHNATSLILPTGANITTAAGDVADFVSLGSGNWRCVNYMRASGSALVGGSGATLSAVNVFTKNQSVTPSSLTSGATIALDASLSNNFKLVLGTNATLSNPTNPTDGMVLTIRVKQDGTGNRTLAYGSAYKWPGGVAPTLSTAANAVDLISMYYDSTDAVWACVISKAFA